jgi:signal peptidase I
MEPTLHCARPAPGCRAAIADRILVRPYGSTGRIERGDVIAFEAPKRAAFLCGSSGIFVKRIIGLPGETMRERAISS